MTQRRKNRVDRESTLLANAAQDLPCCLCFVIIHELNAHARIYTFHHVSLRNALKLPLSIPLILWRKSGSRVASICLPSLSFFPCRVCFPYFYLSHRPFVWKRWFPGFPLNRKTEFIINTLISARMKREGGKLNNLIQHFCASEDDLEFRTWGK